MTKEKGYNPNLMVSFGLEIEKDWSNFEKVDDTNCQSQNLGCKQGECYEVAGLKMHNACKECNNPSFTPNSVGRCSGCEDGHSLLNEVCTDCANPNCLSCDFPNDKTPSACTNCAPMFGPD